MKNRIVLPSLFFISLYLLASYSSLSQTKRIDSLRSLLYHTSAPSARQKILTLLCENYYSLSSDSLLKYIHEASNLPINTAEYFHIKNIYSEYLFKKGKTEEALFLVDSLLRKIGAVKKSTQVEREILSTKASALIQNSQHKEAMNVCLQLLGSAEKEKDTAQIIRAYSILGWVNMELENHIEAIRWLRKGMNYITPVAPDRIRSLYNNLASSLNNNNQRDSAFKYINMGLHSASENQNLTGVANALNIRAAMYLKENNVKAAGQDLEEALKAREQNGEVDVIIADMSTLGSFYAYSNQTEKGIEVSLKGVALAKANNNLAKLIFVSLALADNYKAAKKYSEYGSTLESIIHLKDSLYKKNSEGAIAEMVTKYELQKKENIIIQQENKLIRNRYVTIGSALALLLASIIVWLVYRNYTHIQQRKMENALAQEKIHSIKAVQQAEEKERKRIAADLHDNLGSYAAAISSNIRYLKENNDVETSSIIAQLDDNAQGIVTQLSDTIWVLKNEQLPITKLADRFKAWVQRMIQNYPDVKYHYEETITNDIEFTPGKMLNIFLILKECLNNSLKHSHCTEISIQFLYTNDLYISIQDNGKGFQSNLMNNGNGIENVKHRAKECDLKVKWISLLPSGTNVIIYSTTTN